MDRGKCKYHPEQEAAVDRHGRVTGLCATCLAEFGRRGAVKKWQQKPAGPVVYEYDAMQVLPERIAEYVRDLARPGRERQVMGMVLEALAAKVQALLHVE